jgi:hypothetical protein
MQRPRRFDPDHRWPVDAAAGDQPRELIDAVAQYRQRHRLADQPAPPVVRNTRLVTFPWSIATISRSPQISLSSTSEDICPSEQRKKRPSRLAPRRASFNVALTSYQLSCPNAQCRAHVNRAGARAYTPR